MSRAITMQGSTSQLSQESRFAKLQGEYCQSHWTMKYRSMAPGQGVCLKGMSMAITMQGFNLPAIAGAENCKTTR